MSTRVKNINKEVIEWAIIRNGNSLEDFYAQNPQVAYWVKGEKYPTVKQLENFTHKVHVPFGHMFLPNPPEESISLPFFRAGTRTSTHKVSPIVIGRRALDLGLITRVAFFDFYKTYIAGFKQKKANQSAGGYFYATTKKRVSLRFAGFMNSAVKENKLLYPDAYQLTNLKGDTYDKFIAEYVYR